MSTTSLLAVLVLAASAVAQFDCIMYGDTVAIYGTNGFYLTATGGISARPADAVALRITPTNPWRVGQPLLKGDNFLLLNGSLALRRTTVKGSASSDLSVHGSVRFALGLGQANLTTQTAQISASSSRSMTGSSLSYSENLGLTFGGLAQGGSGTQQNPENSNRRYISVQAGAGACVVVDWWTGDELMRFIPFDCPCISGSYIKYGDRVAIHSANGYYVTATGGISTRVEDAVVLTITPINPWHAGQPLLKGENFLLLNSTSALRRTTVIGSVASDLSVHGSVRFALGLGQANLTTQTAQISSSSSRSMTGSPVSYSETIGLTFGGLAQGGVQTQQNPENSNRRYISVQGWAGACVVVDWWARDEILSFIPAHP
eukprot:m51a1_g11453 hypothetical protein (374) ;mRNA; r:10500-13184